MGKDMSITQGLYCAIESLRFDSMPSKPSTLSREQALQLLRDRLGNRRLVWLGPVGEDIRTFSVLPQLSHAFSLFAPFHVRGVQTHTLETLTGLRTRSLGMFGTDAGGAMIAALAEACRDDAVLMTFSRLPLLEKLKADGSRFQSLSLPRRLNQFLNTKSLVEAALLEETDVPVVPWKPVPGGPSRLDFIHDELGQGSVVLREPVSAGGRGLAVVSDFSELDSQPLVRTNNALSVAPYYADHIPLNVGGCVFPDGGITLHTPSLQLIGIDDCTDFDFGFCGNDFAAAQRLDRSVIEALEQCALSVGKWLHARGYVGAFGIDAMLVGEELLFAEVNPRFQASSRVSARLDVAADVPDIYLDHLMAWLGLPSYRSSPMVEQVATQAEKAQVLCCNLGESALVLTEAPSPVTGMRLGLLPRGDIAVVPDATMFSLEVDGEVTGDGRSLFPAIAEQVEQVKSAWEPVACPGRES